MKNKSRVLGRKLIKSYFSVMQILSDDNRQGKYQKLFELQIHYIYSYKRPHTCYL